MINNSNYMSSVWIPPHPTN
jgi:hypothetical protein